jgi:hypothetical protein
VHKHPLYYAVRNHIIDFLNSRSRSFIAEAGAGYDSRKIALVRAGLPEPAIAATSLPGSTRQPAHIIAWSLWRRAHQAEARRAHLKKRVQL